MGKKSGPKAPPPPPDYSPQRDQYVKSVNAGRAEQAADYNAAIDFFNKQLSGKAGSIKDIGSALSGLDIDYDPENLSSYSTQIDNLEDLIENFISGDVSGFDAYTVPPPPPEPTGGISSGGDPALAFLDSPKYQNIAGTTAALNEAQVPSLTYDAFGLPVNPGYSATGNSYGQAVALNTPNLSELNLAQANKFLQDLAEYEAMINSLESGRSAEESRIKDYFGGYVDDFNNYDIDVAYDPLSTDFDKYMAMIGKAQNELGGFESKLDFSGSQADAQKELDELMGIIQGRQDEKTAEQDRISGFGTDIDTRLGTLRDEIDALGIADVEDVSAYNDRLGAIRDEIKGFDSDLDFNFSGDQATAFELEDAISALQDKRSSELARIEEFRNQYEDALTSGAKNVGRMNEYDLFALEDAQSNLDNFKKDISGFESELDFDFSDLLAGADDPQAVIDALMSDRNTKLAKEQSDVDALLEQISGVSDFDESAMNRLKDNLIDELADLNRYTGGVGDNQDSIEGGLDSIDTLLDALAGTRGGIESEALEALQGYRDQDFNTLDDVTAAEDIMNAILGKSEKYKATQAQDELDLIAALLGDERTRLQGDVDAVAAREETGAESVEPLLDAYGNLLFPSVADGQQDIVTEEALQAYLAQLDDEDDIENTQYQSGFARNLLGQGA